MRPVGCLGVCAGASIGMPDLHSGYGFAIGNVAAVDMDDPKAVVSPGGVGFDINCGVSNTCAVICEMGDQACFRCTDVHMA